MPPVSGEWIAPRLPAEGSICHRCEQLDLVKWMDDYLLCDGRNENGRRTAMKILQVKRYVSTNILDAACQLCRLFQRLKFVQEAADQSQLGRDGSVEWRRRYEDTDDHLRLELCLDVWTRGDEKVEYCYIQIKTISQNPNYIQLVPMQGCVTYHDAHHIDVGTAVPVDPLSADLSKVKTWLRECKVRHCATARSLCSDIVSEKKRPTLRIIDCYRRQVRYAAENEPYICLSYVWGDVTVKKFEAIASASSYQPLPGVLSKTMEDAIFVAIELGIPQLWVDQVCIDQSNEQEIQDNVSVMDLIYSMATLTIIASSGTNAHSGLPGVRGSLRSPEQIINLGDRSFAELPSIVKDIKDSVWNSRGWTYQEALLSRRCLFFTDSQLYFQCKTGLALEGLSHSLTHRPRDMLNNALRVIDIGGMATLHEMGSRLTAYYSRNLSHGKDALRAIEGVLNTFMHAGRGTSRAVHFYGIPIRFQAAHGRRISHYDELDSFAQGLLWRSTITDPSSRPMIVATESKQIDLPTWSWAAIKSRRPNAAMSLNMYSSAPMGQDLIVRFTHRKDSTTLTLPDITMALQTDPYTNFAPSIEVTTWALVCRLRRKTNTRTTDLAAFHTHEIIVDHTLLVDDTTQNWESQLVHLLFLGYSTVSRGGIHYGIEGLLVERYANGTFERIGKWEAFVRLTDSPHAGKSGCEGLLNTILHPDDSQAGARWERETFTIV